MEDQKHPEPVVGLFIRNKKGQILLVKSFKWPNLWVVCGGHIEFGESIAHTCAREAQEEVGLDVEFKRVVDIAEFINHVNFHRNDKHFVGLQSECVTEQDEPKIDNDEIQEARWFSLQDALKLELLQETRHTIELLRDADNAKE